MSAPPMFSCAISVLEQCLSQDICRNVAAATVDTLPRPIGYIVATYAAISDLDERIFQDAHEFHRNIEDRISLSMRVSNEYNHLTDTCNNCTLRKPHLDLMIEIQRAYITSLPDIEPVTLMSTICINHILTSAVSDPNIKPTIPYRSLIQSVWFKYTYESIHIPSSKIHEAIDSMVDQFRGEIRQC